MQKKMLLSLLLIGGLWISACHAIPPERTDTEPRPTKAPTEVSVAQPTSAPILQDSSQAVEVQPSPSLELPGTIQPGYPISIPRTMHTATRLPSGEVLLVGGSLEPDDFVADEELIDPVTGATRWAAPLHTLRHGHTATLLRDGRVLVIGGYNLPEQWLSEAEVYDPRTDAWTVTAPLFNHGSSHTATLMKDGRVLVVGGCNGSGVCTEKVEIFDPNTNSWLEARPLESDRAAHTATLLDDGRVLIAGGTSANGTPAGGTALVYDPGSNSWTATGPMASFRTTPASVKLANGEILVAGGFLLENFPQSISSTVEIYSPRSDTWRTVSPLHEARYAFILTALPDGRALAAGGARDWDCCWTGNSFVKEIELYDPASDNWQIIGSLPRPGAYATGVLLSDRQIWIAGGQSGDFGRTYLTDTWLIQVPAP